jgi:ABC-type polysaccharide/polyol phosphate transport system ATPase subunit
LDCLALSDHKNFIEVSNLTVSYRKYSSASKSFKTDLLVSPDKLFGKKLLNTALKNISFKVNEGEIVGIVGRNGAGKSTLVKAITGILRPQSGHVVVDGKVGALIELTGGFNMDLTLRENIEMHYVFNGLSKKVSRENTPEILNWSGLELYKDQTLHSLSSGMVARFAFATQTSITPDILILDEILSVGDAEFQIKSRLRIGDLIERGSIVIVVSHAIEDIKILCTRVIWLENGSIIQDGPTLEVCHDYLSSYEN